MVSEKAKKDIANAFAKVLGKKFIYYMNLMSGTKRTICLENKVPAEKTSYLKRLKRVGYFYNDDPTRVYHYNNLASHILGYVNKDMKGVMGISEYFEESLKGQDGIKLVDRNAIGDVVTVEDAETNPTIPGDNLYLTIDKNYQMILEEELRNGLLLYGGTSATGIMMNPKTSEILAISNVEDFDPNEYWKYNDFQRRNRAITDTYEPGSTFKSFTIASLVDQKLCKLNEKINVENGNYRFKNVNIKDTHPFKSLSVTEIVEQSSNIGVAKLVQRIDDEKYFKYLRGFGFGNYTSITLPGETGGRLRKPTEWSSISKAYLSFGYEISVTPIQMLTAYCALINGGMLYEPQLVQREIDYKGNLVNEFSPKEVRRVISSETSTVMRNLLTGVVNNGTGKKAQSQLISIGGKTGTSQKLVNGSYSKKDYNSSFIGFFPADDPKVACFILINSPDQGRYGGLVAAPIFKNIAERVVRTDIDKFQENINPELLKNLKFATGNPDRNLNAKKTTSINVKKINFTTSGKMPNLINSSIKDAIFALTKLGIKYKIKGSGIIISQSIPAGETLGKNETCILECSEINVRGASLY
jgi:cell division protein FtsI (penicillin-binding protein 3)